MENSSFAHGRAQQRFGGELTRYPCNRGMESMRLLSRAMTGGARTGNMTILPAVEASHRVSALGHAMIRRKTPQTFVPESLPVTLDGSLRRRWSLHGNNRSRDQTPRLQLSPPTLGFDNLPRRPPLVNSRLGGRGRQRRVSSSRAIHRSSCEAHRRGGVTCASRTGWEMETVMADRAASTVRGPDSGMGAAQSTWGVANEEARGSTATGDGRSTSSSAERGGSSSPKEPQSSFSGESSSGSENSQGLEEQRMEGDGEAAVDLGATQPPDSLIGQIWSKPTAVEEGDDVEAVSVGGDGGRGEEAGNLEENDEVYPVECVTAFKTGEEFTYFLERSRATGTLLVVDFFRSSCGSCNYVEQGFMKLSSAPATTVTPSSPSSTSAQRLVGW
ncbi:LOW QUALITY PROTEIN: hypothetical protein BRADI_3g36725v3 [Brachypodium distachyon]|uniref:Thioredoxin domain-containing protein n=1 Tax=Brachypodium distachyon TaxID=15368 RepID=A0A2K2D1J9_BRADI|nr:LOW QUALITY PROTEIN: hypothetical protein BRADI_3g36725v3 [Brachypodium distachyon]